MLNKLGIDLTLLGFQIFNFLVLLWLLNKLLYKPVLDILNKRKAEIDAGIKLKEEMEKKKELIGQEREEILTEAREKAQELIEHKKKQADKIKERLVKEAQEEKKRIIEQGVKEIESRKKMLEKQIEKQVVDLAAAMAKKALMNLLTKDDQEKIIRQQLNKLTKLKLKYNAKNQS